MSRSEKLVRLLEERFGVAPEFSGPLLPVLERFVGQQLSAQEWNSVLSDVAAAYRACQQAGVEEREEVGVLTQDFLTELKKIDESLKVLSVYLRRIRTRFDRPTPRLLH